MIAVQKIRMTKTQKTLALAEYVRMKAQIQKDQKALSELKDKITSSIEPGEYGDYMMFYQNREVKEYIVPARVDVILNVVKKG